MHSLRPIVRESFKIVKSLLIERLCLICAQSSNNHLCQYCQISIDELIYPKSCITCGDIISNHHQCDLCQLNPPPWQSIDIAFYYDGLIRKLFQQFKFKANFKAGDLLSELLTDRILTKSIENLNTFDLMIPMPLHRYRQLKRGFNQSYFLTKRLSNKLNVPISTQIANRTKNTLAQTSLKGKERHQNLKNAFSINSQLTKKSIIVVDDIITTGSTLTSLCNKLNEAGASKIKVITLAKAKRT